MADVEATIGNIRRSIEDSLADVAWANQRLAELTEERARLEEASRAVGVAPVVDPAAASRYRERLGRLLSGGDSWTSRQLLREQVADVELAPGDLEVKVTYRIPEPVMNSKVAGARCEALGRVLAGEVVVVLSYLAGSRARRR